MLVMETRARMGLTGDSSEETRALRSRWCSTMPAQALHNGSLVFMDVALREKDESRWRTG